MALADGFIDTLEKVEFNIDGVTKLLVGGSFRDIPFFVEEHEFGSGRRISSVESPQVDDPENQDLGRKSRPTSFVAYLLGNDSLSQALKLLDACESEGPGTLVHPYLGKLEVRCNDIKIKNRFDENRLTRVALSFILEPQTITPRVSEDAAESLRNAADDSDALNVDQFEEAFTVADAANFVVDSAIETVDLALDYMFEAKESVRSVAAFVDKVSRVRANIEVLLATPRSLAEQIQQVANFADENVDAAQVAIQRLDEALVMTRFSIPDQIGGSTPQRDQEKQNNSSIVDLVNQAAGSEIGRATADANFESINQASEYIELIDENFDRLEESAISDTAFQTSKTMQSGSLSLIQQNSGDLARVVDYKVTRTVPSLVLSYELSGDLEQSDDILKRNNIPNPNFVPGQTTIELLQDQ